MLPEQCLESVCCQNGCQSVRVKVLAHYVTISCVEEYSVTYFAELLVFQPCKFVRCFCPFLSVYSVYIVQVTTYFQTFMSMFIVMPVFFNLMEQSVPIKELDWQFLQLFELF